MRRICLLFAMIFLMDLTACPGWAWNDVGHLTVARIAWNHLNTQHRQALVSILRKHPHCEQLLQKERHSDATDAEWIFIRAAVWPDHVRPPRSESRHDLTTHPIYKFHRGPWHYVNFPYRAGQLETQLPSAPVRGDDADDTNILEQLDLCMRILLNESAGDPGRAEGVNHDQNKAVRLCWLFHLVADLHQPLHVTALVDEHRFPRGAHTDQGGNLLMIRPHAGVAPHKLHAFWDERLGTNSHFPHICDLAELLTRDPALNPAQLPELAQNRHLRDWAAESYQYAKSTAYHEGRIPFALTDDYEHHRITADDVPVLAPDAETAANRVARRRIVAAGYRLAGMLKLVAER